MSAGVMINAGGGVRIGSGTLIGPGAKIWSVNHRFADPAVPIGEQGYDLRPVVIGEDVWIAANAVVLPGVHIGDGAVVGAGAVVTRDVPSCCLVAGVPARAIGVRGNGDNRHGPTGPAANGATAANGASAVPH